MELLVFLIGVFLDDGPADTREHVLIGFVLR